MSAFLNIAIKAAYAAANIIQQASLNSILKVTKKANNDFVTDIDKKAENAIINVLHKAYPDHTILTEESGLIKATQDTKTEYTWIIDPIDGTTNFIHGHPQYSISIALKHHDKLVIGVVLDPNRNELYTATLGGGAFLNDKRIRVNNLSNLENALIATGFPSYDLSYIDQYLSIFKQMLLKTSSHRRCGSAALDLAYVASGRVDGFWEFNLKQWDFAAGVLLIKEAGGIVTDFEDTQNFWSNGNILASNSKIINKLLEIIQKG